MTEERIKEIINTTLIEEFEIEPADIKATANLFDDLELDSLDGIDLVLALEKRFSFKLEEDVARQIRTVQDIYDVIIKVKDQVKDE